MRCSWVKSIYTVAFGVVLALILLALGSQVTAQAQAAPSARPIQAAQAITYTVQAGDTLARLARTYGVTVEELVAANNIQDPNLILVGQVLTIGQAQPVEQAEPISKPATYIVQAGDTLSKIARQYGSTVADLATWNDIPDPDVIDVGQVLALSAPSGGPPTPSGGPLTFTWSVADWRPADPDYIATIAVQAQGGSPPYTYYHDGIEQQASTFEIAWKRCQPKPGSIWVADAAGTKAEQEYWLAAPYCPVGVEIVEPEEDAQLKHDPRNFNITWNDTVDPPPPAYGIEIEVWQNGGWQPWKQYVHRRSGRNLFFVPDPFPGDLGGRVRMWGIYGEHEAQSKTPWRYFEFRVTY